MTALSLLVTVLAYLYGLSTLKSATPAAVVGMDCAISVNEYVALESLYDSTNGLHWIWQSDETDYGMPWNFTDSSSEQSLYGPCVDRWQGLNCTAISTNPSQCVITSMELPRYFLDGPLPDEIKMLSSLEVLNLTSNFLSGLLPTELGMLSSLQYLDFSDNYFSGGIPAQIGMLTSLSYLGLNYNFFDFNIPTEIGHLVQLTDLNLELNVLSGRVPSQLGNLVALQSISLYANSLYGNVTAVIDEVVLKLASLTALDLSDNDFTGTIPGEVGQLIQLTGIDLGANKLNGSVPSQLADMTALQRLYLYSNSLSGNMHAVIKEVVLKLNSLTELDLSDNDFTGTLPGEVGQLIQMTGIDLGANKLNGSVPSQLADMTALQRLYLNSNSFSGNMHAVIKEVVLNLDSLTELDLSDNDFTGTIPGEVGQLVQMMYINLGANKLNGTIPTEFGQLCQLLYLELSHNILTGSVPTGLFDWNQLEYLFLGSNRLGGIISANMLSANIMTVDLSSNKFQGPLPDIIESETVELYLDNNELTGSLSTFRSSTFPYLELLSVADNGFSGRLPENVLKLPFLSIFDASSNCFTGSLAFPDTMNVEYPFLNELSSGKNCRGTFLPVTRGFQMLGVNIESFSYYPHWYIRGGIPSNIWSQSTLIALNLQGNGLKGRLMPDNVAVPASLLNLSVGFNQLTGTIPLALQQHVFDSVGLSNNRFTGGLQGYFLEHNVNIEIAVNRLSGPLDIHSLPVSTDILDGNLFTFDEKTAASYLFSKYTRYNGSLNLDCSLFVSVALIAWSLFVVMETIKPYARFTSFHEWSADERENLRYFYRLFAYILFHGMLAIMLMTLLLCCFKLCGSRTKYSTHVYQYRWRVSAAFLHDILPVVFTGALLMIVTVMGGARLLHETIGATGGLDSSIGRRSGSLHTRAVISLNSLFEYSDAAHIGPRKKDPLWGPYGTAVIVCLWITGDIYIWAVINAAYLRFFAQTSRWLFIVQYAVSLASWLWNIIFPVLVFWSLGWKKGRRCILFRYSISIMNVIILPLVMTSLTSSLCFSQVFGQTTAVLGSSSSCGKKSGDQCMKAATFGGVSLETAMPPPFIYSYQCSSALIMTYVPVYIYQMSFSVMVSFLKLVVLPWHLERLRSKGKWWVQERIHNLIPTVLYTDALQKLSEDEICSFNFEDHASKWARAFLPVEAVTVQLVVLISLFLTFGLAYPWLGFTILCSLLSDLCSWTIIVGRFRSLLPAGDPLLHRRINHLDDVVKYHLKAFCFGVVEFAVVLIVCFAFWSLVWYDMIADVHGWRAGLISVSIIGFLCPVVVVAVVHFANERMSRHPCDVLFGLVFSAASGANYAGSKRHNKILLNAAFLAGSCELSHSVAISRSVRMSTLELESASASETMPTYSTNVLLQVVEGGPDQL
jgi:Leucine-rich repeat (LRR) protein